MLNNRGGKNETPGVGTPLVLHLYSVVLRCTPLVLRYTPLYSASLVEAYEPDSAEKFRKSMGLGSSIQGRKNFAFSSVFWPNSCSFQWKTARSRRINPKIFRPGILLPIPIDFWGYSAGNGDFSWPFRPVPIVLGDRNPRPELYSAVFRLYSTRTPEYWSLAFSPC
jgi:hypothetical protein